MSAVFFLQTCKPYIAKHAQRGEKNFRVQDKSIFHTKTI